MKKVTTLALAFSLCAAVQAQVVSSEKTVQTESNTVNGAVETRTEQRAETRVNGATTAESSSAYWSRLESAYKHANVPAADIERLRAIDRKVYEVRRENPNADLKTYYVKQQEILQPAQVEKVRTYLKEHRLPETAPAYAVTTYETVPTKAGVEVNTPLGSVGVGVPTGSTTIERTETVPAP